MTQTLCYRGMTIGGKDIDFINDLIAAHPELSRRKLSQKLCEAWDWRQPGGALRDQVCRSLMLKLHRDGHITLPPVRCRPNNPLAAAARPDEVVELDRTPVTCRLRELGSLEIEQVRRTRHEKVFNGLIEHHHYLGYCRTVGEHLKYMIRARGRVIACMTWGSAPWHVGSRDRYIGWSAPVRRRNIHHIACNTRFLILPWVRVKYLASHLLGVMAARISDDWMGLYNHPLYYLETFVDIERFRGTCYRAANWMHLGQTTGRWRQDKKNETERHIKDVYGYWLSGDFRERLCDPNL